MSRFAKIFSAAFLASAVMAGCGGGETQPQVDAAVVADLAHNGGDLTITGGTLCSDPRADAWALPIAKSSMNGSFKISLTHADYSPPIIGANTWQLTVADASDAPVSNAVTAVKPWMPDMGHGTSVVPQATAGSDAGSYTVTPLYFFMAGLWATTFTLTDGMTTDTVVYTVCLAD